jgi:hypothetical protein
VQQPLSTSTSCSASSISRAPNAFRVLNASRGRVGSMQRAGFMLPTMLAANGDFRPAPTSAKLGWTDLRSDNLGFHLITHTTLARSSNAVDSICPTTTKALLPLRLQLTTTAVLARPSTTARHSTFPVLLQSLHVAPPAAAVSINPFSTDTSVPPQPTAMAACTLLPTLVF